jgi:hypothetical protein
LLSGFPHSSGDQPGERTEADDDHIVGETVELAFHVRFFPGGATLGLSRVDRAMLGLALAVGIVTLSSGHTKILQDPVHLVLFRTYPMPS